MIGSNRVLWESLGREVYEDMVAVLLSRLHPNAQRFDGSGGDGGRDVQIAAEDGLVIYQLKSQTGRMNQSRRRQVASSLVSASQHSPTKWFLVVPIDPTPGESEWFDQLVEPYGFECRWLGKTWLDSEMAQKPEIARYYAHGDRLELSEFLELVRGINPDPLPGGAGVLGAAADSVQGIVDRLNRLDPHFVFALSMSPDGRPHVSVIPRYPGAERDRPPFSVALAFPDTEEGASAQQALQETVDFGAASVVPSEFISELVINVPAGLGAVLEGYEMALGGPTPALADDVRVVLKAVGGSGAVEAQLPLVADEASSGARGALISLADNSKAVTAEIRLDVSELAFSLSWAYSQPDVYSPLELLPAARFAAALEGGEDAGRMVRRVSSDLGRLVDEVLGDAAAEDPEAHAISLFRQRDATREDRRSAVVALAGVLEERRELLKEQLLKKDERALFEIANKFALRHRKANQRGNYDDAYLEWIFYWYLATVHLTRQLSGDTSDTPQSILP